MNLLDTAAIFRFHKEQIKEYGSGTIGALGWTSAEAQLVRFKILSQIADLNHQSVLDVGCGHGDLRVYLGNLYPELRYFGVEQIPELLDKAIEKYADIPETLFFQGDFTASELPTTDYVLICGSLNYRNSDPLFVLRMIEKLFNTCRKGMGFNLLSNVDPPDGLLTAYKPDFIVEYCRQLTPNVGLIDGYRENDFTVFMYHTNAQPGFTEK
ncbi:MAG: class I SAM-dependent methyltransferase [Bacteroidota bacterium]